MSFDRSFTLSPLGAFSILILVPALLLVALPAWADAPSERVPGAWDAAAAVEAEAELASSLLLREGKITVPVIEIAPDPAELAKVADAPEDSGRLLVGTVTPSKLAVDFAALAGKVAPGLTMPHARGVLSLGDAGLTWTAAVRSPGATAVRLHFVDFSLPAGAELFVYNEKGEAHGPYTGLGVMGDGEFWSHTVTGDTVRVQLRGPRTMMEKASLSGLRFEIADVVHLGERFQLAAKLDPTRAFEKAFCSFNASCVENASCSSIPSAIQSAEDAVAHLQFNVGTGAYICSGGLVNDTDSSTTIPYLLTANHCFDTSSSASSLEAFFQFTTACGGSCGSPGSPSVNGSTLLATSSTSDYTLVELSSAAPAGSTLLGWTTTAVANSNGTNLYRVSHPSGAPQAYSEHSVDTSAGTCGSWPRGDWIYSRDTYGATEGGSSGSPVLNSSGQIVGQLSGGCGTNTGNVCDSTNNATVDGALAAYFSSVSQWLDPDTGCNTGSPGDASYCTTACPCDEGGGDCDSDSECASGLECMTDTGPDWGFASWVDVCEQPDCHVGNPGDASYCSSSCPCDNGLGDCDSDAECVSGTSCQTDTGPDWGFASWVDVCETDNDPNSCQGYCGTQAPGGCWCDSACATYGDCCPDKTSVCG